MSGDFKQTEDKQTEEQDETHAQKVDDVMQKNQMLVNFEELYILPTLRFSWVNADCYTMIAATQV